MQAKSLNLTWLSTHESVFRGKYTRANKHIDDGKESNDITKSSYTKDLKIKKKSKGKPKDDSKLDAKYKNSKFYKFTIGNDPE